MPPRGRLLMLPLRQHASFPGIVDEVVVLPEIPLPPDTSAPVETPSAPSSPQAPGTGTPQPSPAPPSLFQKYGSVPISDITAQLPRNTANYPNPRFAAHNSLTVHWEGPHIDRELVDADMVVAINQIAMFHIQKDWGNGQGGSGIMYHEVIAPSGRVFITRDYEEVLWHAGNNDANLHSRAILVYCAKDLPPTEVQLFRLSQRVLDFRVPVYPHRHWSPTECPGDQLAAYVAGL